MIAGLIVLTACVYWPVYHYPFIQFDDPDYVSANPHVQDGFSSQSLHYAFNTFKAGNWNPLLWISFYIDRALFHARPGPIHVENAILHLISGLLLWWFLCKASKSLYRSYIVAALFLVAPMHVESVTWISERKDVLSTPFLLAAMLAYLWFVAANTVRQQGVAYVTMLLLFAISLMVKTMGITLPAVLLLLDYWPLGRWPRRSWFYLFCQKIPLFSISIVMLIVGMIAQAHAGATTSLLMLSAWDRIANAIVCYVLYISKLILPVNLAVLYVHPGQRPAASVFASLALLGMISYFVLRLGKKSRYGPVGWLWFLGTLVPVIGLFQVGSQAMADRYSYFPSVGLFILIVWAAHDFFSKRLQSPRHRVRSLAVQMSLVAVVIVTYAVIARIQVFYWKDSEALFRHDLDVADDNPVAHVVLGGIYGDRHDIKGAVDEFTSALKVRPNARANFALGNCWQKDNPALAKKYFHQAVELEPVSIEYRIAYADILLTTGEKSAALEQARQATAQDPSDTDAAKELKKIQDSPDK
jgi:tetratricopeptide (TPR) repeat protein